MLFIVLQNFITIIASLYYSGRYVIIRNVIPIDYLIYSGVQLSLAAGQLLALVLSCSATATEVDIFFVSGCIVTSTNFRLVEWEC